jgi:hypothetical protein
LIVYRISPQDNIPSSTPTKVILSQGIGFNMKQSAPALMKDCSTSLVPGDEPDTWDRIFDQNQITETIIERNQNHFGQAHGTPFTVSPLVNWAGYHGTSESADALLRGELPPDELEQCTEGAQAVLAALQQEIAAPNSVDTRITADDLQSGFKKWRESTSTSPSGQHLGYYKSIAAFERTPEDDDTPRVSERIFGVLANMVDAALQTGFIFDLG